MNYDLQDSDLSTVLTEGRVIADETIRTFGRLSAQQINWAPRAGEWSIGQCFDHLIISNRPYFQIIDEIRDGRRQRRAWERMPLLPRFFGKLIITTLRPDSGRKAKARPAFYPSTSHIAPGIIASFLEQQDRLLHLMGSTRGLDLDGIIITSPVISFVTYSLMDAYRIIVVHEQNHFVQARRVMESSGCQRVICDRGDLPRSGVRIRFTGHLGGHPGICRASLSEGIDGTPWSMCGPRE